MPGESPNPPRRDRKWRSEEHIRTLRSVRKENPSIRLFVMIALFKVGVNLMIRFDLVPCP